ncbi:MAG: GNAT family N-acetyltransferase [Crocosphaera sp.]
MNNLILRPAYPQDALGIAQLTIIAGGGMFEFLLEDLLQDNTLENIVASEIEKETGNLSYLDTEVVELNSKIIGIINSGDSKKQGITQEIIDFFPPEKINWVQELFSTKIEGSLYVYILAVDSHYRKQGIGKKLMNHVENKARKQNISSISLTVWSDNINAIKFYEKQGFKEVKHIKVDYHPLLPHHGGMKLMQCLLS